METFICIVLTAIISFISGQFFLDSRFSRFEKLEEYMEENLRNKQEAYNTSITEFKNYIQELRSDLESSKNKISELQKENDTLSGIFIAFKEKYKLENKKSESALAKTEIENKALTNFV